MSDSSYVGRTPEGNLVEVEVRGGKIRSVVPVLESQNSEKEIPYILPVLVDLQHNGALGAYYGEIPDVGVSKLHEIAAHLRSHGVGRCLLTLVTQERSQLERVASFLGSVFDADRDLARLYCGIFHEGIYVSPRDGWRGAHAKSWIEAPNWERLAVIDELTGGRIRLVNVAPEEPGGLDFITKAVAADKTISLGHCCPTPEIIDEAIARGASMVTHFGNGAAAQIHRFNNPLWTFLDRDELTLGLICDGSHLPGSVVRTAMKCKGREKCLPVSDASGCSGLPAGPYEILGERLIEITPECRVHMAGNPDILAGGWFQQDRSVEFLVKEAGLSFLDAWDQCSRVPARAIGLPLPDLVAGEEASFVLARWENGLVIEQSVHAGVPAAGPAIQKNSSKSVASVPPSAALIEA